MNDNKPYKYIILGDSNAHLLTSKVQEHINAGWEPFGSLTSCVQGVTVWLFQPMIKR